MTDKQEIICVICPTSCRLAVTGDGKSITDISGYGCKRGSEYGRTEYLAPVRILATTMRAENYVSPVIAVRSDKPLPKGLMFECIKWIRETEAVEPFFEGKVVIENIMDTGSNIILSNC
jgi:CxxC motif-containing protein